MVSELTPFPETRELLQALCGFGVEAEALPLQLLCNMYRGALRAPLEALVELVEFHTSTPFPSGSGADFSALSLKYSVMWGLFAKYGTELEQLYRQVNPEGLLLHQQASMYSFGISYRAIFRQADQQWFGMWSAILLHRLTWEGQQLAPLLGMLEILLTADPGVARCLLRQARDVRPLAVEVVHG